MRITFIFIIIMTLWIPLFIYSEYKWGQKNYLYTKTFSSLLFLSIGILGHLSLAAPQEYSQFIIAALVFGLIGDVLLVYYDKLIYLALGLLSFLVGQIIYGALFLKESGYLYYDIILYMAIITLALLAYSRTELHLGKMKLPVIFYMLAIAFMYTMALSTIYKGTYSPITTAAIVFGATLFALSDMVLAFSLFKSDAKPVLKRVNMGLYFYGQMILASSIITFGI